jgi:TM2 domain-containing membrane protein YozV
MAMIYCYECGKKVSETASVCPHCGAKLKRTINTTENRGVIAFLLAFLLGPFGAHRFYVGKNGSAVIMLVLSLTIFGLFITGIWSLIDMIMIICGKFTDAKGKKITF